jgi:hypothetical protein
MSTKYEPVGKNILVEAVQISSTITIPGTIDADEYRVLATGKEVPNCAMSQTVILAQGIMTPVKNTKMFLTHCDNVLAIVK